MQAGWAKLAVDAVAVGGEIGLIVEGILGAGVTGRVRFQIPPRSDGRRAAVDPNRNRGLARLDDKNRVRGAVGNLRHRGARTGEKYSVRLLPQIADAGRPHRSVIAQGIS